MHAHSFVQCLLVGRCSHYDLGLVPFHDHFKRPFSKKTAETNWTFFFFFFLLVCSCLFLFLVSENADTSKFV